MYKSASKWLQQKARRDALWGKDESKPNSGKKGRIVPRITTKRIMNAYRSKRIVKGKVLKVTKGGLTVSVLNREAYCPWKNVHSQYSKLKERPRVGETFRFIIVHASPEKLIINNKLVVRRTPTISITRAHKSKTHILGRVVSTNGGGLIVELNQQGKVREGFCPWSEVDSEMFPIDCPINSKHRFIVTTAKPGKILLSQRQAQSSLPF